MYICDSLPEHYKYSIEYVYRGSSRIYIQWCIYARGILGEKELLNNMDNDGINQRDKIQCINIVQLNQNGIINDFHDNARETFTWILRFNKMKSKHTFIEKHKRKPYLMFRCFVFDPHYSTIAYEDMLRFRSRKGSRYIISNLAIVIIWSRWLYL